MPETLKLHDAAPGVAVVAFNRPEVANALSTTMGLELLETWTALREREDLRCVILT
ncbi:MAG: enoyl-CoA hydratase, partial [Proteobacteria bacterium]|nr:enoyl-CoA hydratase [Pseudomonadota bacterium]